MKGEMWKNLCKLLRGGDGSTPSACGILPKLWSLVPEPTHFSAWVRISEHWSSVFGRRRNTKILCHKTLSVIIYHHFVNLSTFPSQKDLFASKILSYHNISHLISLLNILNLLRALHLCNLLTIAHCHRFSNTALSSSQSSTLSSNNLPWQIEKLIHSLQ
jgi:hypothetical protein